jgi:hypothetical protein
MSTLKESTVKQAQRALQWLPLMKHVDGVHLDAPTVEKLIGRVRRTSARLPSLVIAGKNSVCGESMKQDADCLL